MKWQVEQKSMKPWVGGKCTKGESVLIWYRKWKMKWTESACTQTVETVDDESVCWKSRLFNEDSLWAQTRALGTTDISQLS